MKKHRTPLPVAVLAVTAFISVNCLAKDNTKEQALRTAEKARFEANVKADVAALDKLLDADLDYTHSNGELETKTQFIESLVSGKRKYLAMDPTLDKVRIYGDVAVIRGSARVSVATKDAPGKASNFSISYTDVWLWKAGRWQMMEWRSTRLPDTPAQ